VITLNAPTVFRMIPHPFNTTGWVRAIVDDVAQADDAIYLWFRSEHGAQRGPIGVNVREDK
jgi:hypothetical protein